MCIPLITLQPYQVSSQLLQEEVEFLETKKSDPEVQKCEEWYFRDRGVSESTGLDYWHCIGGSEDKRDVGYNVPNSSENGKVVETAAEQTIDRIDEWKYDSEWDATDGRCAAN